MQEIHCRASRRCLAKRRVTVSRILIIPFTPRDRTNLANGIRLHIRRPKSDGREIFVHYTMRRPRAIIAAAASAPTVRQAQDLRLGPEVSAELLTALNKPIRAFKLEREYKIALLKRQGEWPPITPR